MLSQVGAMDMLWTTLTGESPPVLRIAGEIDISTADQLRHALDDALAAGPEVVVDMSEVTFIDACGLGVLLQAARSMNGHGPLTLQNAARVAWLFDLVGVDHGTWFEFVGEQ
jgi:anti-sigma B factor antagonist